MEKFSTALVPMLLWILRYGMSASTPNIFVFVFSQFPHNKEQTASPESQVLPHKINPPLQMSYCCCPLTLSCFSLLLSFLMSSTFLQLLKLLMFLRAALLHSPYLTRRNLWLFQSSGNCLHSRGSGSSLHVLAQQ